MDDTVAMRIEADLLDLGMTKATAAAMVAAHEAGRIPGLGGFVGQALHFGLSARYVEDAVRHGWYRDWRPQDHARIHEGTLSERRPG